MDDGTGISFGTHGRQRWPRLDAAIRVLYMRGQPMTPREIVTIGFKNRLFEGDDERIERLVEASLRRASNAPPQVWFDPVTGEQHPMRSIVRLSDGRYALAEWGFPQATRESGKGRRRQRANAAQDDIAKKLNERLREVQDYLDGLTDLAPDRVCLLIEFCYLLELNEQAVDLHRKLPKERADEDWLRRVDRLVRVCRQRMGQ